MTTRRKAYTLIELLLVLAILSVVLGTVSLTVHTLFRSTRRVQDRLQHSRQVLRFAEQFRLDIHAASTATTTVGDQAGPPLLTLAMPPNRVVQYACEDEQIVRTVLVDNQPVQRDSYPLIVCRPAGWQVDRTAERVLVAVQLATVDARLGMAAPRGIRLTIQAAVSLASAPASSPQS